MRIGLKASVSRQGFDSSPSQALGGWWKWREKREKSDGEDDLWLTSKTLASFGDMSCKPRVELCMPMVVKWSVWRSSGTGWWSLVRSCLAGCVEV